MKRTNYFKEASILDDTLRQEYIRKLQLPSTASWVDIAEVQNESYRLEKVEQYGLDRNATWKDILRAESNYILQTRIPS